MFILQWREGVKRDKKEINGTTAPKKLFKYLDKDHNSVRTYYSHEYILRF